MRQSLDDSRDYLTVDRFANADREPWFALWGEYAKDYEPAGLNTAIAESNWNAVAANDGRLHALCARDVSGVPAGFAHYVFHHCTKSVQPECYLIDLFVSRQMRGRGGGRLLLNEVIADCGLQQLSRVTWITRKENVQSQALYETMAGGREFMRYVVEL